MRLQFIRFLPAIAALALCACAALREPATLSRGPYLQMATSDSIVIVWRTLGPSTPIVRVGSTPEALNRVVRGDAITLRVSADVQADTDLVRLYQAAPEEIAERAADNDHDPSTAPNTYQYEARISDLEPGTKYYYAIYDGRHRLAGGDGDHYFVSHPPIGSEADMRIWVVGDSGTGGTNQAMVHEAMRDYVAQTGRPLDHYIHVGDMAYSDGTDREFQEHFFAPYQATLRHTVCWPTMGNHEGHTSRGISGIGPYYDAYVVPMAGEVGGAPSGTEAYYSFNIADVHFICLDSHDLDRGPAGAMAQWLRADLEQTEAKWLIAFWHHPPYTMGSHNSDREHQLVEMRETFMPILESGGVDLTLTGHSHIYERSMLMDGAYATPTTAIGVILDDGDGDPNGDGAYRKSSGMHPNEGSVSVVAGHGGTGLSREGTMPVMREIILEHGSVILDINGDTLTGTMVNKNGETRDIFSIVKRGSVTPTRVENPWQPVHDLSLLTEVRLEFGGEVVGAIAEGWSVAHGNPEGLAVAKETGGQRNVLRAEAGEDPLVGLYTLPWHVQKFEYTAEFRLSGGSQGAGLVFGYVDTRNYGRIDIDADAGTIRASRVVDGEETVIAEGTAAIPVDQWIDIEMDFDSGEVDVNFDNDTLEFTADFGTDMPALPLGFRVSPNSSVEFLEFAVED